MMLHGRGETITRVDPAGFVDQEVVWRDFCCPGCGVRLATEVAYPGEAPFQELRLD